MAITKVPSDMIQVANNVTDTTIGGANSGVSVTFDSLGVISAASNVALSINTADIADGAVTSAKLAAGAALSNGQMSFVSAGTGVVADTPESATPYKILGQIQTVANTMTNVYVVPASTESVLSSVFICNQTANTVNVDLAARQGSQALGNEHYIVKDYPLAAADTLILEPRLSMNATSVLSANVTGANASSNVSVNAFGIEVL